MRSLAILASGFLVGLGSGLMPGSVSAAMLTFDISVTTRAVYSLSGSQGISTPDATFAPFHFQVTANIIDPDPATAPIVDLYGGCFPFCVLNSGISAIASDFLTPFDLELLSHNTLGSVSGPTTSFGGGQGYSEFPPTPGGSHGGQYQTSYFSGTGFINFLASASLTASATPPASLAAVQEETFSDVLNIFYAASPAIAFEASALEYEICTIVPPPPAPGGPPPTFCSYTRYDGVKYSGTAAIVSVTAIPEPSVSICLALALAVVVVFSRRRMG